MTGPDVPDDWLRSLLQDPPLEVDVPADVRHLDLGAALTAYDEWLDVAGDGAGDGVGDEDEDEDDRDSDRDPDDADDASDWSSDVDDPDGSDDVDGWSHDAGLGAGDHVEHPSDEGSSGESLDDEQATFDDPLAGDHGGGVVDGSGDLDEPTSFDDHLTVDDHSGDELPGDDSDDLLDDDWDL